jgi:hypothetical protein
MKKVFQKVFFSLLLFGLTFSACKKENNTTQANETQGQKMVTKKEVISQSATLSSTEYVYLARTNSVYGGPDPIDNWDTFRIYQEGSNRNLRVEYEAREYSLSKPLSAPLLVGPGIVYIHAYPNYFYDYSLENEYMNLSTGSTGGVKQKVYVIKIKKVIDFDTKEDITSKVNIFPTDGIKVQITMNTINLDTHVGPTKPWWPVITP